jgi:alpha-tubulin suppressor-like RCC1 family protein
MWRIIGGEDFQRRVQLKDSLESVLISERGAVKPNSKKSSTAIFTWGMGYQGQLGERYGRGDTRTRTSPVKVSLPPTCLPVQVACGGFHTAVLSDDGCVFTWGEGKNGQLGYPCVANQEIPRQLSALRAVVTKLACGRHHTVAIDDRGKLWAWGCGKQGQIGDGERSTKRYTPKQIQIFKSDNGVTDIPEWVQFTAVTCGGRHTLAQSTDARIYSFGSGQQGQLGHGALHDELFPRSIAFFENRPERQRVSQIAASSTLTAVVTATGELFMWGMGDHVFSERAPPSDDLKAPGDDPKAFSSKRKTCSSVPHQLCQNLVAKEVSIGQAHIGLGRVVALYHRSSTLYQIH